MTIAPDAHDRSISETTIFAPGDIVGFGTRWAPYGGASALDIMVEFGWTTDRFFTELHGLIAAGPPDGLSAPMLEQMLDVCRRRIGMGR